MLRVSCFEEVSTSLEQVERFMRRALLIGMKAELHVVGEETFHLTPRRESR